ncbi:SCO family protein [Pseudoduganella chitinolytica]|uniref:SCO family protein n=1 Tax=Pseudoduganella chitinolytica TaxID=34070 RepID=A0ABY8BAH8_9BURK|nr:SCO family protein [Pseudoduganella chitinolytica]WEF32726.1 SCO family protein [Pseudoduganella chitinolytica]
MGRRADALLCAALACTGLAHAMAASPPRQQFVAPAPGSYRLEAIQAAPDGEVLAPDGAAGPLRRYTTGKVTLLSFMYTYCVDPVGCPLAFETFSKLRTRLLAKPAEARRVRFVSLSFDPTNDTPTALRHYAGPLASPTSALRWHFLTTRNVAALRPIIDGFGQDVAVTLDEQGRPTRLYNHLLKVFLIDGRGRVREIYTTAYLMPDVILNDIRTLLLEP